MDRQIEVRVSGDHLWKDSNRAGVQGEGNVTTLRITFDEGWSGYAKSITFFNAKGKNPVKRNLTADLLEDITESTLVYLCKIPPEPLTEAGRCSFVIEGFENDKRQRVAQTELDVLRADETTGAADPADPTPTQAEQLQSQIENIIGDMQEQAIIATDAANNAKTSEDNAKESEEAAERAQQAVEGMTITGEIVDPHSNLPALERSVEDGVVHLHLNIRQGFSGVYVGDGEMPEGYNVQVDPNGTGMDVPAIIESALQEAKDSGRFDGVSPSVKVTPISGGTRVTITDANGTKTFVVMNGKDGTGGGGGGGGGADGVTFYPYVDENGNLSWTNDGGLDNPDPVNIMGRPGDPGDPGDPGVGISSIQFTERSGDYANNILKITTTDGKSYTFNVKNGGPGTPGGPGDPGDPGANATINGVNALTVQGGDGIEAAMSGSTLTIKAKTVEEWIFTLEDDSTVTKKVVLV